MRHWAYDYIGLPWIDGATGPKAFGCWGLVSDVLRTRLGFVAPDIVVKSNDNISTILQLAKRSGWVKVEGLGQEYDVVFMEGLTGRHVGILIQADRKLHLLHSHGTNGPKGPTGCVVIQPLSDMAKCGFRNIEFWRRS